MAVSGILLALQLFCLFKLLSTPSRRVPCYSDEIDAQLIFYGTFSSPRPFFGQEILARFTTLDFQATNSSVKHYTKGISVKRYLFIFVLLLSNDVELNPGPNSNGTLCGA